MILLFDEKVGNEIHLAHSTCTCSLAMYRVLTWVALLLGVTVMATPLDTANDNLTAAYVPPPAFRVKPFTVNLSSQATRMINLVKAARLPDKPEFPGLGSTFGADLDKMKQLQTAWTTTFSWSTQEAAMNK